ncbi:hypothetical protein RDI58_021827 [Solanum bulbocastanum]|uniref:Uncharacterized protein n=1 Tax=Solanum bulbocastanum TaxID=147425 RepID=A0AAN8T103_SOLBU
MMKVENTTGSFGRICAFHTMKEVLISEVQNTSAKSSQLNNGEKFRTSNFLNAKYWTNVHPDNVHWCPSQSHSWEGVWDWTILIPQPNDYIKEIIARFPITINQDKEAIPVWTVSVLGAFMVSSAWESHRQRRYISQFNSKL